MKKYGDFSDDMALFIAVPDVGKEAAFRAAEPQAEPCLGLWEGMAEMAYVMAQQEFRRLEALGFFEGQQAVVVLDGRIGGYRRGWIVSDRNEEGNFHGPRMAQRVHNYQGRRWEAFADIPFGPGYTFIPSTGMFYALV